MAEAAPPAVVERFKEGFERWNGGGLDLTRREADNKIVRCRLFPDVEAAMDAATASNAAARTG